MIEETGEGGLPAPPPPRRGGRERGSGGPADHGKNILSPAQDKVSAPLGAVHKVWTCVLARVLQGNRTIGYIELYRKTYIMKLGSHNYGG